MIQTCAEFRRERRDFRRLFRAELPRFDRVPPHPEPRNQGAVSPRCRRLHTPTKGIYDCTIASERACRQRRRLDNHDGRKPVLRKVWRGALGLLLASMLPLVAVAQGEYPIRGVTLVTPYAPGGGSDLVTRVLADALRRQLAQTVSVQNVSGGGGNIGVQQVARAPADGYTLLLHHIGMATAPALFQNPGFDPVASFEQVGLFADMPMLLVGNKDVAASTMAELLAWVRAQREDVTFASSGQGSATHLCAILFQQ